MTDEALMARAEEFLAAVQKQVELAGLSYLNIDVLCAKEDAFGVIFYRDVNGQTVASGVDIEGIDGDERSLADWAKVAVDQNAEWFTQLETEVQEDIAVAGGGARSLNPETRISPVGYWAQ